MSRKAKASDAEQMRLHLMMLEENRIKSFIDWPYDAEDCTCTSVKLAEAGFYHCATDNEPDAVRCFVCHKELDGWEPQDIPLQEHKKHSKDCPFLTLSDPKNMTVGEALEMTRQSCRLFVMKQAKFKIAELLEHADQAIKQLEKLL